jgi:hypothetical protein
LGPSGGLIKSNSIRAQAEIYRLEKRFILFLTERFAHELALE